VGFSPLWYFLGIKKGRRLAPSKLSDLTDLTWDAWPSADEFAAGMEIRDVNECVTLIKNVELSADFVASIFNSSNISVDKCASILNDANISVNKAIEILKSPNLSADKAQAILYNTHLRWARLIEILTADAPDLTVSEDMSVSGIIRYKNLTVDADYTLHFTSKTGIIIADTITANGTISANYSGGAGGASPGAKPGYGYGGNGGGGLIILCKSLYIGGVTGAILANGQKGGGTNPSGTSAAGEPGEDGYAVLIGSDDIGSGATGLAPGAKDSGLGNWGGGGGSHDLTYKGGDGGSANITRYATANDLYVDLRKALVDWWLQNVAGKTPATVVSFPTIYGAGGGGGGCTGTYADDGGAGGSGGEIIIVTDTFVNDNIIRANGGDAGSGGTLELGGGGGGGIVYVLYNTLVDDKLGLIEALGGDSGEYNDNYPSGSDGTARAIQISI